MRTLSCLVQSSLCLWVDADVSGLIRLHSAVRHPAQTMKQACGPYTLPSCFRLPSVPVRTSCHMTWQVMNEGKGDSGAAPSPCGPPRNPSSPGARALSCSYTHTHAKPLCTNALLLCQHTYESTQTRTHTQISSTHRHTHTPNPHKHSLMRSLICIRTYAHSTHNLTHTSMATHMHKQAQQTIKHNLGLADA